MYAMDTITSLQSRNPTRFSALFTDYIFRTVVSVTAANKEVHTYTKNTVFFWGGETVFLPIFCANPTVLGVLVGHVGQ